jgi:hypothetical protein
MSFAYSEGNPVEDQSRLPPFDPERLDHLMEKAGPRCTACDFQAQLEAGMVISIETELHHKTCGFIKLEDTVAITDTGWEAFGDGGRGWNICGS